MTTNPSQFDQIVFRLNGHGLSVVTITDDEGPLPVIYWGNDRVGMIEYNDQNDLWELVCETEPFFHLADQLFDNMTLWAWYGDGPDIAKEAVHTLFTGAHS